MPDRQSDLKTLSIEALETLLLDELESRDPTAALLLLEELEQRSDFEKDPPWNRFCQEYLPLEEPLYLPTPSPKIRSRIWLRQFTGIAAAACLACMLMVQAGGVDLLRTMIHWTGDALFVESPAVTTESSFLSDTEDAALKAASSPAATAGECKAVEPEAAVCTSLPEGLALLSLESWAPAVLPEGFSFSSAEVEILDCVQILHAVCTNEAGELLQINCHQYSDNSVFSSVIMKDDAAVETMDLHNTTFYFLSNGRYEGAVWMVDEKTEFHISGPVTRKELKDMIRSISP